MAGRRQASVGEDKPSPTKVAAVTAPSKKSERQTALPQPSARTFSSPKIEIMFTTGRTQPGVPCRHLLLLPVALCGPSAGRIFALSGRLLGFLPVYFCVRFSLVFSLSAFGRRARFGPSGAIFFLLSFLRGLPSGLLSWCSGLPCSAGRRLSFTFAASRVLFSFVFLSRRPVSLFLSFSLGASFPLFLWFLSRFCSLLYFIRFLWVLPFCGYFLIYFYFIFIFFYLSAYR